MNGADFLETAFEISQELFPSKVETFTDDQLEQIIEELEARTDYIRKAEYLP